MKICFCRTLLALAIIAIAVFFWTATWAKIAIIVGAALLAVTSLFYQSCCCRLKGEKKEPEASA
jgi:hypothetical protein